MRTFAILIVLFQHSLFLFSDGYNQKKINSFLNLIDGVSIFFVLSGFLIGNILIRAFIEKEATIQSLFTFWKRRWLRTIPSYYLVMTIVLVLSIIFNRSDTFLNHISYFFFLQNICMELSKFYPEAWSLSIEEWFYFLFPLILFLLTKYYQNKLSVVIAILLFLVFPLFFRFVFSFDYQGFDFRKLVIYRLDAIVYGVLVAYVKFKHTLFFSRTKYYFFAIGLILLATISILKFKNNHSNFTELFYSLEALSYCLSIPVFYSLNFSQKSRIGQLIYYISSRSYLFYLINLSFVLGFIIPFFKNQFQVLNQFPFALFLLFWIINLVLAELIYQFFERPILAWRDQNVT